MVEMELKKVLKEYEPELVEKQKNAMRELGMPFDMKQEDVEAMLGGYP
jgi:hypothetical protein